MRRCCKRFGFVTTWLIVVLVTGGVPQASRQDNAASAKFETIVLGAAGGLQEQNLTAYLLAPKGDTNFVALDAGTLLSGIMTAKSLGSFDQIRVPPASTFTLEGWVLREHIKAYLISHAHLDHVSGLILNAPEDSKKTIMGLAPTIDTLRDHIFNWQVWPNFGHTGREPRLHTYTYVRLTPGQEYPISGTAMTAKAFRLSHSRGYPSTAFLIQSAGFFVLYCGDTGPDAVENSTNLHAVWTSIAPLIRAQKLRALFLEVSYPDGRPDHLLFGHLTPSWLLKELRRLARMVHPKNPQTALARLTVVVTHIKPSFKRGPAPRDTITQQLNALNDLGVRFVMPRQGRRIEF